MLEKNNYCAEIIHNHDRDRFLLGMMMPAARRNALWPLFALNHEIAKTREVVSETILGQIRLKWWMDEIDRIYAGAEPPAHEVLAPLAAVIRAHDLPREDFEILIHAREFDLEDVLPSSLEGMVHYADFTNAPLLRLALRVLGDEPTAEPLQPVAVNYGLVGLLRAVPFHAAQRRCFLPQDLMERHGVSPQALYKGQPEPGLREIVKEVLSVFAPGIRCNSRFLGVSQKLAELYAQQIRAADYDLFSPRMQVPPPFKELKLLAFDGIQRLRAV